MNITANSASGRLLLAMRAGRQESAQLRDAFPTSCSTTLSTLYSKHLIEKVNGYWQLTQAGRDSCPNRRDAKLDPMHESKTSKSRHTAGHQPVNVMEPQHEPETIRYGSKDDQLRRRTGRSKKRLQSSDEACLH